MQAGMKRGVQRRVLFTKFICKARGMLVRNDARGQGHTWHAAKGLGFMRAGRYKEAAQAQR